jgi:hypothetical protein
MRTVSLHGEDPHYAQKSCGGLQCPLFQSAKAAEHLLDDSFAVIRWDDDEIVSTLQQACREAKFSVFDDGSVEANNQQPTTNNQQPTVMGGHLVGFHTPSPAKYLF